MSQTVRFQFVRNTRRPICIYRRRVDQQPLFITVAAV
jgi:hypothetical protein